MTITATELKALEDAYVDYGFPRDDFAPIYREIVYRSPFDADADARERIYTATRHAGPKVVIRILLGLDSYYRSSRFHHEAVKTTSSDRLKADHRWGRTRADAQGEALWELLAQLSSEWT